MTSFRYPAHWSKKQRDRAKREHYRLKNYGPGRSEPQREAFQKRAKAFDEECKRLGVPRPRDARKGTGKRAPSMRAKAYELRAWEQRAMFAAALREEDAEMRRKYVFVEP